MRHVVWDWNGTLLDDQRLVLQALNAVLVDAGLPPTDAATYRRLYTRPIRVFYERLFGRPLGDREWARVDEVYHEAYHARLAQATLTADARDVLEDVEEAGLTQSLLSMYRHHELVPLVRRLGVADHFVRIDGLRGPGGGRKARELEAHLGSFDTSVDPRDVLVVGDALDDARAAAHVGTRCVLYDGGSHPRAELEQAGVPVVPSLSGALEVAGPEPVH